MKKDILLVKKVKFLKKKEEEKSEVFWSRK
jgi:hypothetical protein